MPNPYNHSEERLACEDCETTRGVDIYVDPYRHEIEGVVEEVLLCDACYQVRRMDV